MSVFFTIDLALLSQGSMLLRFRRGSNSRLKLSPGVTALRRLSKIQNYIGKWPGGEVGPPRYPFDRNGDEESEVGPRRRKKGGGGRRERERRELDYRSVGTRRFDRAGYHGSTEDRLPPTEPVVCRKGQRRALAGSITSEP